MLRRIKKLAPALLFLFALGAFLAGRFFLRARFGDNRFSLILAADPADAGIRLYVAPHSPHDPDSLPWVDIFRCPPLPPNADVFFPDFAEPVIYDWRTNHGFHLSFPHTSAQLALGSLGYPHSPSDALAFLILPHSFTLSATSLLLLTQLLLQFRTHRRPRTLLCRTCRYDLRASTTRCPECGTPISPTRAPATPFPLRPLLALDLTLRTHPRTAAAALFLITLTLSITCSPITYTPPPAPPITPIPTHIIAPITLLYPLDDLLTNPHSPLTGTPQDRFQQLSDLITAIDREHWATHGGELPSPTRFHHTMLITAPPTLHTQIHSLLTHLPPQPTTSP